MFLYHLAGNAQRRSHRLCSRFTHLRGQGGYPRPLERSHGRHAGVTNSIQQCETFQTYQRPHQLHKSTKALTINIYLNGNPGVEADRASVFITASSSRPRAMTSHNKYAPTDIVFAHGGHMTQQEGTQLTNYHRSTNRGSGASQNASFIVSSGLWTA